MQLTERHREYWRKNLRITTTLLLIWFFVTYVIGFFAKGLSSVTILGFPFPFWVGAQGALIVYLIIIWLYAHYMNKLDQEYGVAEREE